MARLRELTPAGRGRIRSDLVPAVLVGAAALVIVLLAGQVLVGAVSIGIGVDEFIHVIRFEQWLDTGHYITPFTVEDGEPDPTDPGSNQFIYGAAFSAIAHLANVVLGVEAIDEISTEGKAYEVRHLVVGGLGLAAVAGAGAAVWAVTRDRIASLWGAAALLAIPVWTGNSMFNVKDTPVAAGYTLVTVGLVLALTARANDPLPRRRMLAAGLLVGVGTFVGAGTRAAMWLSFLISLLAFAALGWLVAHSARGLGRLVAAPAAGYLIALGGIAALHPSAAATPFDWLYSSVTDSSGFEFGPPTLTAGELVSPQEPPVWYLPAWLFAGVPVLIFAIAGVGLVSGIRRGLRLRTPARAAERAAERAARARDAGTLLVALQFALVPAGAIVLNSSLYDGLRQHLYVLPAVAILAGIGVARLLATERLQMGRLKWALPLVLALALVIPTVEQTRLYPYNYIYVNPVAGIGGVEDRWETELQGIVGREAFHKVPATEDPRCLSNTLARQGDTRPWDTCVVPLDPFREELGQDATVSAKPGEIWVVGSLRATLSPPDYCREHDRITRPLRGEELVIAYVLVCDPP